MLEDGSQITNHVWSFIWFWCHHGWQWLVQRATWKNRTRKNSVKLTSHFKSRILTWILKNRGNNTHDLLLFPAKMVSIYYEQVLFLKGAFLFFSPLVFKFQSLVKRPIWAGKSEIFKFPLRFKTDKLASSLMALGMVAIMLLDKSNILKTGNRTLPVPDEEVWILRWSKKLSLRIKVRRLSNLKLVFFENP